MKQIRPGAFFRYTSHTKPIFQCDPRPIMPKFYRCHRRKVIDVLKSTILILNNRKWSAEILKMQFCTDQWANLLIHELALLLLDSGFIRTKSKKNIFDLNRMICAESTYSTLHPSHRYTIIIFNEFVLNFSSIFRWYNGAWWWYII